MIEYVQRDEVLRSLGFADYGSYLESRLWSRIRERALKIRSTCACCNEPATDVHHRNYSADTLTGKNIGALTPLCRTCHDLCEFTDGGEKATLSQANARLDFLLSLEQLAAPPVKRILRDGGIRPNTPMREPHRRGKRAKRLSKREMILAKLPPELRPAAAKPPIKPRPLATSMFRRRKPNP